MKYLGSNFNIATLVLIGLSGLGANSVQAMEKEIGIERVFVAAHGFDDNDEVQIVIDGRLPNSCFQLGRTEVINKTTSIHIKQFAQKRSLPGCGSAIDLPTELSFPFSYSLTINLGQLQKGTYKVKFSQDSKNLDAVDFMVEKASSTSIDNIAYSPVSSILLPELIYETNNGQLLLTGILDWNCHAVGNVKVIRTGSVFVILPKLKTDTLTKCTYAPRPLEKLVKLGKISEGRYLIHVRSANGRGVNRLVTVLPRTGDPSAGRAEYPTY